MLIFDADDTLWENNVIFERVIDEFLEWMAHPELGRDGVRAVLDGIEAANAVTHGYGSKVFLRSLGECVERLRGRAATADESARISGWAAAFDGHRVELIPGVPETLAELARRHELLLLTKGDTQEQERKVAASGLTRHFRGVHIVAEKDVATYEELTRAYELVPAATWMIGNSPKSDILPARAAGMNAVFIPNDHTWVLEHSELDPDDKKVLRLSAFGDLLRHF
ncbi:HAD family hydrolase [Streptomyces piniterrae]|uniref:HAD family hydrolase n=1 Tax=Streptomyces piniterrae TaxID=2571125 RepID=A0A4U0MRJ6_9ACTN|nr:HAD family hydrolase [Streptomyces piniterrae]TJZ43525.1 HAD family hydrolase [Streptomyces piniterrae]